VSHPEEIANYVIAANARQYHQVHDTPFGSKALSSYFGYRADTAGADALVNGQLPPCQLMETLLSETQAIIHHLANYSATTAIKPPPATVETSDFQSLYKPLDERTSSSASGCHLSHYKVAATCKDLSTLHASMMTIPYLADISPKWWHQVVDVMLEKKPGDHKIHQLRIVALQESDFNQSNRLLLGKPIMYALEDCQVLPDIQYGSQAS